MNVVLINPPITPQERYSSSNLGASGGRQAPLGICYLAAVLEKNGIVVKIIDAEAENLDYDQIILRIKKYNASVVGVTSTTVAFYRAVELAKKIKENDTNLPVILGGPHVTSNPEHALSFDYFDIGVLGEGEITLLELVKALENGADLKSIDGITFRENSKLHYTKPRGHIRDLDTLPFPARHLLPDTKLYVPPPMNYRNIPVLNLITSRGCPNRCIFCDRNIFGQRYRYHSPEYVVSEIEHVINEFGAREIAFVDDTFTMSKKRVEKIIELMKEREIEVDWTCMARVNTVTKELLQKMKEAGCWHLSFGIESGNQNVLDFIKKGITLEQVKNAAKWANELNLYVKGFFIVGHPIDTKETIAETIKFAKSLPLTDIVVTLATPIPNTELFDLAPKYGTLDTTDWSKYSYWRPVFVPNGFSEEYLLKEQKRFYREFYLRPITIYRHMRQIKGVTDIRRYMKGARSLRFIFE